MVVRPGSEELTALFRGQLNRVVCQDCEASFVLDVPLLYRDDASRFLVYLTPSDEADDWETSEEKIGELADLLVADLGKDVTPPECRLVTDRSALVEKIAIRSQKLDDRIVEYIKYQLYNNPNEEHRIDAVRNCLRLDFSNQKAEVLAFLVIDRETGAATAGAHLPMDVYTELNEAFQTIPEMRQELDVLFPGCFVSVDRLL